MSFEKSCNYHHNQDIQQNSSITAAKIFLCPAAVKPSPPLETLAATDLFSTPVVFVSSGMSGRWNHIPSSTLILAGFPQQNVFEIHSCRVNQQLFLFIVSVPFDFPLSIVALTSEFNFIPLGQLGISSCFPQPPTAQSSHFLTTPLSLSFVPQPNFVKIVSVPPFLPPSVSSPPTPSFHSNLASTPTSKSNCSCQEHLLVNNSVLLSLYLIWLLTKI